MTYKFTPEDYQCPVHGTDFTKQVKAEATAPPEWYVTDGEEPADAAPPTDVEPGPFAVDVTCPGVYEEPEDAPADYEPKEHIHTFQGSFM